MAEDVARGRSARVDRALRHAALLLAIAVAGCSSSDSTGQTAASEGPAEPADVSDEEYVIDVSACPDAATEPIEGPIRIGSSMALSGGPAVLFSPFGTGMQAYVDYYNEEFGGVDGREVQLIIRDDQYSADLTTSNVDALIFDEDVAALAGVMGSPPNLAIRDLVNDECVPQIWSATGGPEWGEIEQYPWTSGLLVGYEVESAAWADYVLAQQGEGATVALFYVNNEFGRSFADAFAEAADERGLTVVLTETIDPASSASPSAQMSNLVAADPDAILAVPLGAQCIAFMTELGNARAANPGFDPLVYLTATCASETFFDEVRNGGQDGVYSSNNLKNVYDPDVAANDEAVAAYLEALAATGARVDPGGIAADGWIAAELTIHVLEEAARAGDLSRRGIMNAARNIDASPGLLRDDLTFRMNANDAYIADGTQLVQWRGDGFVEVGEVTNLEGELGAR